MEAKLVQGFTWMDTGKMLKRPIGFICVSQMTREKHGSRMFTELRSNRIPLARRKTLDVVVSTSLKNSQGPVELSAGFPASLDESLVLKNKSQEIEPYLNGRCIYLVGMMGSGKTTIGKILSEGLGYSFCDSDDLLEQTMGGMSVAEIFKQHGEAFFRDKETEVLQKLSVTHRLVVSTGGGAVIRPINWKHMQKGISVWIDVPVECLARRVTAAGTSSRPLLHGESGDAYTKALTRLSMLLEERAEAYANASARVSLELIAAKLKHVDVDDLTPTVIAIEVLEQIKSILMENGVAA